mmetsp:Transcript_22489/g.51843  ORF Transcript_22489/g.51843 Transcript_22489/m.51843 type:complete len:260 (+) Transcript_22489:78-857(+)
MTRPAPGVPLTLSSHHSHRSGVAEEVGTLGGIRENFPCDSCMIGPGRTDHGIHDRVVVHSAYGGWDMEHNVGGADRAGAVVEVDACCASAVEACAYACLPGACIRWGDTLAACCWKHRVWRPFRRRPPRRPSRRDSFRSACRPRVRNTVFLLPKAASRRSPPNEPPNHVRKERQLPIALNAEHVPKRTYCIQSCCVCDWPACPEAGTWPFVLRISCDPRGLVLRSEPFLRQTIPSIDYPSSRRARPEEHASIVHPCRRC